MDPNITRDIALIWVDVQGYEGYVFNGAKKFLSKGIPVVSEIWPYGILRTGMSLEYFCEIIQSIWSYYWVIRRGKFIKYPTSIFYTLFDELGIGIDHENVIFAGNYVPDEKDQSNKGS